MDGALKLIPGQSIVFTVPGLPKGKERPRHRVVTPRGGGKPFTQSYTPKQTKGFEADIQIIAKAAMKGKAPMSGPVRVTIFAFFPIPKSYTKKRQKAIRDGLEAYTKKPDEDNIGKAVKDAMNGVVYCDDSQIIVGPVHKDYSDTPRVIVRVTEMVMPDPASLKEQPAAVDVKGGSDNAPAKAPVEDTVAGPTACGAKSIASCPNHSKPGSAWCVTCLPPGLADPRTRKHPITVIGEDVDVT